ncbi:unnamed protein product [Taenia asiatica]|uniref:ADF-H domain-containing protein n=1 Tax=Taenia asiatica TaxID=60517 RepID=A0A3P6PYD8_TAEAS|nr:unnamed protein product [Taenia asiatica]
MFCKIDATASPSPTHSIPTSSDTTLASISEDLTKAFQSFKFRKAKGSCAIINDLSNELCQSEPRYVLVIYEFHHDDGRVSYPYCLIFSSPRGSPSNLKMLYAGSLHHFIDASQVTKASCTVYFFLAVVKPPHFKCFPLF